jgi:hypothetical protein
MQISHYVAGVCYTFRNVSKHAMNYCVMSIVIYLINVCSRSNASIQLKVTVPDGKMYVMHAHVSLSKEGYSICR